MKQPIRLRFRHLVRPEVAELKLRRPNGATIGELVAAFGTLPHSGELTVELKHGRYRV